MKTPLVFVSVLVLAGCQGAGVLGPGLDGAAALIGAADYRDVPFGDGLPSVCDSAFVDIDSDGDLDLAVARSDDDEAPGLERISIFLNDGAGGLHRARLEFSEPVTDKVWEFAWGDCDSDGRPDVALWHEREVGVKVFRNAGGLRMERVAMEARAGDATVGGCWWLEIESRPVLVCAGSGRDLHRFAWRDGRLAAMEAMRLPATALPAIRDAGSADWEDYDRDGHLDLALAPWSGGAALRILRNDGHGAFVDATASLVEASGFESSDCAWSDLNGDGWPDLVLANRGQIREADPSQFLMSHGGKELRWELRALSSKRQGRMDRVAAGDFDGNGTEDLLFVGFLNEGSYLVLSDGRGGASLERMREPFAWQQRMYGRAVSVGDLDRNGRADVFVGDTLHATLILF